MELKPLNIDLIPEPLRPRLLAGEPVAWAVDGEPKRGPNGGLSLEDGTPLTSGELVAPAPFRDLDRVCPTCGGMNTAHLATLKNESVTRYNHVTTYGTVTGYCVDCHDGRLVVDIVGPCPHLVPCWCPPAVRLARATVRCHGPVEDDSWRSVEPLPLPGQWVVYVEPMMEGS